MNLAPQPATSRDSTIVRLDRVRRPFPLLPSRHGHKEWLHFCVLGRDIDLLVNFSLSDPPPRDRGTTAARVSVLVRAGEWDGDVETVPASTVRISVGRVDLRFGSSTLRFHDGVYTVTARLDARAIAVDLVLHPETQPIRAPNIPRPDGPPE